jgi:hypothetical protein
MIVQVSATTPPSTPAPSQETPPSTIAPPPVEAPAPAPLEAAPATEPAAPAEVTDAPTEPARLPRVSLRIELDLEAGEAHVGLDESSDRVRLVFEDGAWRIAPAE